MGRLVLNLESTFLISECNGNASFGMGILCNHYSIILSVGHGKLRRKIREVQCRKFAQNNEY
jgi:hypothetical protein